MRCFNFPRLAAVLVTAIVGIVACAQGPGTAGPRGPSDTVPTFAVTVAVQTYTEGVPISPLTLPEASGGDGTLSYSLTPSVPGLTFNAATRALSGTPTSRRYIQHDVTGRPMETPIRPLATLPRSPSRSRFRNRYRLTPSDLRRHGSRPDLHRGRANQPADVTRGNSGHDGTLSYSLTPSAPGLTFNAATRALSGTPTTAGTYNMTYRAGRWRRQYGR